MLTWVENSVKRARLYNAAKLKYILQFSRLLKIKEFHIQNHCTLHVEQFLVEFQRVPFVANAQGSIIFHILLCPVCKTAVALNNLVKNKYKYNYLLGCFYFKTESNIILVQFN